MDRDEVEVHKLAKKKERGQYPTILTEQTWSIKEFIIWLLVKFCLRDTAGSPERARWLHLARSGSQSQRAIWFILPAHGACHIIKAIIDLCETFFSLPYRKQVVVKILNSPTLFKPLFSLSFFPRIGGGLFRKKWVPKTAKGGNTIISFLYSEFFPSAPIQVFTL